MKIQSPADAEIFLQVVLGLVWCSWRAPLKEEVVTTVVSPKRLPSDGLQTKISLLPVTRHQAPSMPSRWQVLMRRKRRPLAAFAGAAQGVLRHS